MSIIDKNKASLCVLCPAMLHRVLVKMYPVGETYEKVEETEEQVLSRMVKSTVKVFQDITGVDTTRKKEGKVIPFEEKMRDRMMELPKAYAFPKEKDLQKGRPIVPYRTHCLRKELQCAAKALLYIMEKLQDEPVQTVTSIEPVHL